MNEIPSEGRQRCGRLFVVDVYLTFAPPTAHYQIFGLAVDCIHEAIAHFVHVLEGFEDLNVTGEKGVQIRNPTLYLSMQKSYMRNKNAEQFGALLNVLPIPNHYLLDHIQMYAV